MGSVIDDRWFVMYREAVSTHKQMRTPHAARQRGVRPKLLQASTGPVSASSSSPAGEPPPREPGETTSPPPNATARRGRLTGGGRVSCWMRRRRRRTTGAWPWAAARASGELPQLMMGGRVGVV